MTDEFTKFNDKFWSRVPKGSLNWNKYMAQNRDDLSFVSNNQISLKGINNDKKDSSDNRKFLTGGVTTAGKFAMQYGKIEIKCRLEAQAGAWPALWMMPQSSANGWPNDGEIDIIERLNGDNVVYTTVHTKARKRGDSGTYSKTANIDPKWEFHTYTLEWTPKELIWKVDDKIAFTYKNNGSYDQFPFINPFYMQMSMQLEGWAGAVNTKDLPVTMSIDYVKIYAAYQEGGRITKFVSNGKEITESQARALVD